MRYIFRIGWRYGVDMSRAERIFSMADEIKSGSYPSVKRFREMFEVSERTVHDDLTYLKDRMRMDVQFDRDRGGYFNGDPNWQMPPFDLDEGEVFALILGKEMLAQYAGTSFEGVLRAAIEKIAERLTDKVQVDFGQVQSMVQFRTQGVIPISRKLLLDLTEACNRQLIVELAYTSASKGERTERAVHPYRIIENRGLWYLVAYCETRKALRHFALHRIEKHNLTDVEYPADESLHIDEWLKSAFQLEHGDGEHQVRIRFSPSAARYVRERIWHPSQQIDEREDGGCTMSFVAQNLDEVKRWVLPYGAEAIVLEPEVLRNRLRGELTAAANNYREGAAVVEMKPASAAKPKAAAKGAKRAKTGVRQQLELDLEATLQANAQPVKQLKIELPADE